MYLSHVPAAQKKNLHNLQRVTQFLPVLFFSSLWKLVLDFAVLKVFELGLFGCFMSKLMVLLFFLSEEIQTHLMHENVERGKKKKKNPTLATEDELSLFTGKKSNGMMCLRISSEFVATPYISSMPELQDYPSPMLAVVLI